MIEQELNKTGHRVWTTYDHMDGHFIPSFISIMNSTQYLIVCLSDMYTLNNRCRTEFLYATTFNHRVLSWKVHIPTNNPDEDEQIRIHAVQTLLNRITLNDDEKTQTSSVDIAYVQIHMEKCSTFTNFHRRQRTKEMLKLENWTNVEVLTWCQAINLPGFFKLLANFDGRSVVKLYEFCKRNSTETISLLNHDLHNLCEHDNIPDIQISVHEFIRFQIEVEKLFSTSLMKKSSSKLDIYKKRSKIKICSIL
jgi:hypothetical protein